MSRRTATPLAHDGAGLEEALRAFPALLESLRQAYGELEERAERVESQLVRTNAELESKLRELDHVRRHLEAVLDSLPNGVIVRDAAGRIVRVNGATGSMLGAPAAELVGRSDHAALPPRATDGEPREVRRPDGRRAVIASHYATVRLADGTLDGSVEILDDRTEHTALVERLHGADKMAALGTLAAGVAHEIRNPLNAVKGFASLMQRELAPRPAEHAPAREHAGEARLAAWAGHIVAGASEVDALVENMLTFGSPERLRHEAIDGAELLASAARAVSAEHPHDATIELAASAPPFVGDRLKLRQGLRNLLENAVDAQGRGGRVHVALGLDGDEVVVRVADAGPGVPRELRQRVFDPFFTTRAEGTGLGLALVSTIARLHGGRVEVASEPSFLGGAEILLRIPFQPAEEPEDFPNPSI